MNSRRNERDNGGNAGQCDFMDTQVFIRYNTGNSGHLPMLVWERAPMRGARRLQPGRATQQGNMELGTPPVAKTGCSVSFAHGVGD